jgi:U3 small nucleolar RNA-associated protein 25
MGRKRGKRGRGGGGSGDGSAPRRTDTPAVPSGGGGAKQSYAKLLGMLQRAAPAEAPEASSKHEEDEDGIESDDDEVESEGEEEEEEDDDDDAEVDEEDADDAPLLSEEALAAGKGEVALDEGDDDIEEEAEDATDAQWISASYESHYGGEWPSAELDDRRAGWGDELLELPGLGATHVQVAADRVSATLAASSKGADGKAASSRASSKVAAAAKSADAVLRRCGVLPPLRSAWRTAYGNGPLSDAQSELLSLLSARVDMHCAGTPLSQYAELTPIMALHAAQHIVITQKLQQRHKRKGVTPQDRGFTRPTVLVLLPFRAHALSFVKALLALLPDCYEQVENKARFLKEYDEEEGASSMPAAKPDDYKLLFDGNNDDCFRCALRLTRKAAKLYSSFYSADIIVGSPLGLRTLLGGDSGSKGGGKRRKNGNDKDGDDGSADWLSSIELALVPYADVLLMQNWAHVHDLFELLNRLPTQQRDTDFSRVRSWYLEGDAKRLRQTAVLSTHQAPELSALMRRGCTNAAGRVVTAPSYTGILGHAPQGIRQLFVRFDAADPASESDARLKAFRDRLLPSLLSAMSASAGSAQTMLYVPRYFDFVRVRELLVAEDVPFAAISEYSTPSQVSRARGALQRREVPLLLYTERAHFFRRHKLGGARHLAVYSPPSYAHFYTELLQQLDRAAAHGDGAGAGGATASGEATCVMLVCKLDVYPLQRLVGTERAARMLGGSEASFLFC